MTRNPVRISRVRPKNGGAAITIFPATPRDTQFIRTLVFALKRARAGNVRSFAMVFRVEMPNGDMNWVRSYAMHEDFDDPISRTMLLGALDMLGDKVKGAVEETWEEWTA
jgi:hypothetical protein